MAGPAGIQGTFGAFVVWASRSDGMDGLIPGLGTSTREKTIAKTSKSRMDEPIFCRDQKPARKNGNAEIDLSLSEKIS
jgi:hypothetical protein